MSNSHQLDQLCINTIRMLSADGVQKANSGHPGLPMGCASIAYVIWTRHLKHNPTNPHWIDRDRFVLSAGHGSMLLYSLLHLTGYDLPMSELQNFRQWGSKTPGHPEHGLTPGVETTTGPLGQGFGNGIGMAIAEKHLAAHFNKPGHEIVNHKIYAIVSDGDLMEGISSEAASLAGHLKLGNLIYMYDDNRITIEGSTDLAFTEDRGKRFEAYGWHVQHVADGNDINAIDQAIKNAEAVEDKPSIIVTRTHIGYGSPNKQDTAKVHGSPLGMEELKLTKDNLGWPEEPMFYIPEEALSEFRKAVERGKQKESEWKKKIEIYSKEYPKLAKEFKQWISGELPSGWDKDLPKFETDPKGLATRKSSEKVLNSIAKHVPNLMGGSADLSESTLTIIEGSGDFEAGQYDNRNMHFGVREHGMAAICNGMALHGGVIPYGATFLIFTDYARPSIRLAAIMEQRVIYVMTHDGIGLGEDGPTHQAVEHYMALRAIPHLWFIRPCDANETAFAWKAAILRKNGPTVLALTRQNVPTLDRTKYASAEGLMKGGYILADAENGQPDIILIATGSEVQHAVGAYEELKKKNISVRVVSLPCWELFEMQTKEYRNQVLPPAVTTRLAVETGVILGWERYVGTEGEVIGLDRYGASAPFAVIMKNLGFTTDNVVNRAIALLKKSTQKSPR